LANAVRVKVRKEDVKTDDIATSSIDDMYAFSQISAGGHKLSQVVSALEQDIKKPPTTSDEDNAILAFSNTLPGNDDAPVEQKVDPKI
jgi:hypothetical protein